MLTVEQVFSNANDCGDHPLGIGAFILDGITTVVAGGCCSCASLNQDYKTCGGYCETESFAVGKIKDGNYLVVSESSDSTGHGCQCSGFAHIYPSLDDALDLGLTETQRDFAKAVLKGGAK